MVLPTAYVNTGAPGLATADSAAGHSISTFGVLGFKAINLLRRIAKKLAEKWDLPYSQICGLVRARVSIAILLVTWTTHLCLRGSRIPASKTSRRILWEDGAGVGLFKTDY